jgi:hypothetical protein
LPGSKGSGSSPVRSRRSITASAFLSSARHIQRPARTCLSAASAAHCAATTGPGRRTQCVCRRAYDPVCVCGGGGSQVVGRAVEVRASLRGERLGGKWGIE